MIELRRRLIKGGSAALLAPLLGSGLLTPGRLIAAEWNRNAFSARTIADALKAQGYANASESRDIVINAPEIAENGAKVEIDITSNIPNTRSVTLFADKIRCRYAAILTSSRPPCPTPESRSSWPKQRA